MTSVNCVARGCGTVATSPLWSVLANIQTRRVAPMEAPPPPSPPHPPRRPHPHPHPTPPPRLHHWARKAPKNGIFSPSGNSPDVEAVRELCWSWLMLVQQMFGSICWIPELFAAPLSPQPLLLVSLLLRIFVTWSFHVLQRGTLPYQNVNTTFGKTKVLLPGRSEHKKLFFSWSRADNHQGLCWCGATSCSSLLLAWHTSMGFVGRGHIRFWGNQPAFVQTLTAGQIKLEVYSQDMNLEKKCSCVFTMEYLCE